MKGTFFKKENFKSFRIKDKCFSCDEKINQFIHPDNSIFTNLKIYGWCEKCQKWVLCGEGQIK